MSCALYHCVSMLALTLISCCCICTGDYLLTATAIAKGVGLVALGADALARDAKDLRLPSGSYHTDMRIDEITSTTTVFARATPEDKIVIVRSLQRLKHIVAMTGDGTNESV